MQMTMDRPPNLPPDIIPSGTNQSMYGGSAPAMGDAGMVKQKMQEIFSVLDALSGALQSDEVSGIIQAFKYKLTVAVAKTINAESAGGSTSPVSPQGMLLGGGGY